MTTAPIFQTIYLAAIFSDEAGITLDHRGHLLALIRVYHKYDFVVTHEFSLRFKQLSLIRGLAGKHESKEVAAEAAGFFCSINKALRERLDQKRSLARPIKDNTKPSPEKGVTYSRRTRPSVQELAKALAQSLVQANTCGYGHIQAIHVAKHRDVNQLIAVFSREPTHTFAFGTHHKRNRAFEICLIQGCFCFTSCTDQPDSLILQSAQKTRQVRYAYKRYSLCRTAGDFASDRSQ